VEVSTESDSDSGSGSGSGSSSGSGSGGEGEGEGGREGKVDINIGSLESVVQDASQIKVRSV